MSEVLQKIKKFYLHALTDEKDMQKRLDSVRFLLLFIFLNLLFYDLWKLKFNLHTYFSNVFLPINMDKKCRLFIGFDTALFLCEWNIFFKYTQDRPNPGICKMWSACFEYLILSFNFISQLLRFLKQLLK